MEFLSNYFKFKEKETNLKSETIGGITTFLTMAYALFLIPSVLAEAGMPQGSVFVATGLAAALGTLIMGIFANFPMGLAPGVGLNAFFAYSVCLGMGIKWEVALSGVLASGIIFLIISATGLREMIIKAIPTNLKFAVSAGIGLFIAFIGLKNAGIVVANSATFVGYKVSGIVGSIFATLGITAISFILVSIASKAIDKFKESKYLKAALLGMRPVLIALIINAFISLAKDAYVDVKSIIVTLIVGGCLLSKKIHPILTIVIAGLLGIILWGII